MSIPTKRVAVYAGSFDPPGRYHRIAAERMAWRCDEVIVLPSGPRIDRPLSVSFPVHRAVMADLNFRGLPRVRVELSDLESGRYTSSKQFTRLFGGDGVTVYHVVTGDTIRGGKNGTSRVHQTWSDGPELWATEPFIVLHEPREPIDPADLPPQHELLEVPAHSPSSMIRSVLFDEGESGDGLLTPEVASYISRHGLFRPTPPARECIYRVPEPRIALYYDRGSAEAAKIVEQLRPYEHPNPEVIVSVGGDGTMLRAIRKHWRDRLPFFGVNTGHLGFLLNDRSSARFWEQELRLYQLPLLWVEMVDPDGKTRGELAFNDCWIERETGQTAWVEVSVNNVCRMEKVVADGMLVATAAGSTSYARAMRATPLPFNAPLLTLAGSNVLKPEFWHPAVLTIDSEVRLRNLDPAKRPLRGFLDGVKRGAVVQMTARVSNIAAVELLFTREHDPVSKLAMLQFPQPLKPGG